MAMPAATAGTEGVAERLLQRWRRQRDRWLADPVFRHAAATWWPTRWLARRRARALFDLVAGFVYSQVLLACVRLRLFDLLADGPLPPERVAALTGLGPEATQRLVDAAAALQLLEWRGAGGVGLGPLGAAMCGNTALQALVEHHATLYTDLADPVALLRARPPGALNGYWPYAGRDDPAALAGEQVAAYTALMTASQVLIADVLLDAYPVARHRHLLDVGGGAGAFALACARRAPALQITLFDLPAVAAQAHERFARAGLGERGRAVGGDFHRDALPRGADLVSFVRVLHDHDDAQALHLLQAAHAALPRGGRVLIAEPMAQARGAETVGAAYFGVYLWAMGSGRPRSAAELGTLLQRAGFEQVRRVATALPLQCGLVTARRSA